MAPKIAELTELIAPYCGPDRHYHNFEHIADMFQGAVEHGASNAQMWAILFHDIVYDARRTDNEERSAEMAVEYLQGTLPDDQVEAVRLMVLSTKAHKPLIPQAELVIDLDMRPLAVDPQTFERNRALIRKEYAHVSDADFARGTAAFARGVLAYDQIFYTPFFIDRYEADARRNLKTLLQG